MLKLPILTIKYALALIAIGFFGFVAALAMGAGVQFTALIPAVFGALIGYCGKAAFNPKKKKLFMHIAVVLALLLAAACLAQGGIWKLGELGSREGAKKVGLISQSLTAAISLGYLFVCIKSFIAARK